MQKWETHHRKVHQKSSSRGVIDLKAKRYIAATASAIALATALTPAAMADTPREFKCWDAYGPRTKEPGKYYPHVVKIVCEG